MTAKEAKEKALWNELPPVVKERIMWGVGSYSLNCELSLNAYDEDTRKMVYSNLNKLGYAVVVEGTRFSIYWN